MRGKKLLALLCALMLLLPACGGGSGGEGYLVYFVSDAPGQEVRLGGSALDAERRTLPQGADPLEGLVECLLSGPISGGLRSPIPDNVRQLSAPAVEDGVCQVNLSEGYGSLSGVELTLADYCITLTLCQVPGVEAVSINVQGAPIPYRNRQILRAEDVHLTGGEDQPVRLSVWLYYPTADGTALTAEHREIAIAEEDSSVTALLTAFLEGPREPGSRLPLPEGTTLLSAWSEGGVCYVNFSAPFRDAAPQSRREARLLLYAVVNTLCQLPGVESVRLLVEGESLEQFGDIPTSSPLEPNWDLAEQ